MIAPGRALLIACLLYFAGCDTTTCADTVARIERCGAKLRPGVCDDEVFACLSTCYRQVDCKDVPGVFLEGERLPAEVRECTHTCSLPFECADGELLPFDSMVCDAARDCADGSDEEGC